MKARNPKAKRYDWLGPVRMLIISLIALGYASTMPRGAGSAEYLRMFGYDPSWYGISVLFMITGWLALRSLHRHGSSMKFLASRLGRNLPILVIFAASVPLILFPLFGVAPEPGTSRLDQHVRYFLNVVTCINPNTLTPGLLDNALYMCIIQGGLWTFRWGMIAFIATAIMWVLGALNSRRLLLFYTIVAIVLYSILFMYGLGKPTPTLGFLVTGLRLALAYFVGMTAYAYRDKLPRNLMMPAGLLTLTIFQYFVTPWTPMIEVTASLALGYLAIFGFTSNRSAPKWVRKTPDLSLGLYVLNWPIAQIVLLSIPTLSPIGLFAVSFPVTILVSLTLWALVTRKTNQKLNAYTQLKSA